MKRIWIFSFVITVLLAGKSYTASAQTEASVFPPITAEAAAQTDAALNGLKSADEKERKKVLTALLKPYKKDAATTTAIAVYLLQKGLHDQALEVAEGVYKLDNKYIPNLILMGDIYQADWEKKNLGKAAGKYDEVALYDASNLEAKLRWATVYKDIAPDVAKETLLEVKKTLGTEDARIDQVLAGIYYKTNEIPAAIATYQTYLSKVSNPPVNALSEYALLLYINQEYEKSLGIVNQALPKAPKLISLNRMKFYNLVELNRTDEAKAAVAPLFGQYPDSLYNYFDYSQRAKLAAKQKDFATAIADYKRALALSPDKLELNKELSDVYKSNGDYDNAIAAFRTFLDKMGDRRDINDVLAFGKLYYSAASTKELAELVGDPKKTAYIAAGDSVFAIIEERVESYIGPFWRARINSLTDTQNPVDAAKLNYENTLKRLEGKDESYNSTRKEALNYLSFYYMKKNENASAKIYNQQALAIDPNDALAIQIATVLK